MLDFDVHFGAFEPVDWRKVEPPPDPDDEELDETPEDVVRMLGFDPKELDDELNGSPLGGQT